MYKNIPQPCSAQPQRILPTSDKDPHLVCVWQVGKRLQDTTQDAKNEMLQLDGCCAALCVEDNEMGSNDRDKKAQKEQSWSDKKNLTHQSDNATKDKAR